MSRECRTCGNPEDSHPFRHPFVGVDDPFTKDGLSKQQSNPSSAQALSGSAPPLPIDPVLRIALIDKGILTPDDIAQAQAKVTSIEGGQAVVSDQLTFPEPGD